MPHHPASDADAVEAVLVAGDQLLQKRRRSDGRRIDAQPGGQLIGGVNSERAARARTGGWLDHHRQAQLLGDRGGLRRRRGHPVGCAGHAVGGKDVLHA